MHQDRTNYKGAALAAVMVNPLVGSRSADRDRPALLRTPEQTEYLADAVPVDGMEFPRTDGSLAKVLSGELLGLPVAVGGRTAIALESAAKSGSGAAELN